MGIFENYLLVEAGMSPAEKKAIDMVTKQINAIDLQIQNRVGPTGKGKLMTQTGELAGHLNDQDPQFKTLTARRAALVARKIAMTNKADKIKV